MDGAATMPTQEALAGLKENPYRSCKKGHRVDSVASGRGFKSGWGFSSRHRRKKRELRRLPRQLGSPRAAVPIFSSAAA